MEKKVCGDVTVVFTTLYVRYRIILIVIKCDIGSPENKRLTINFRQNRIRKNEYFTSICARKFIVNSQVFIEEKNILNYVE